jgi:hypothetical protein
MALAPEKLAQLHQELRAKIGQAPLFDTSLTTKGLEEAFDHMLAQK